MRDPRVAKTPTWEEVAVELKGANVRSTVEYRALDIVAKMGSMLRAIVCPPGTPPEVVAAMR